MKRHFAFTLHNMVGHPLMEVAHLLKLSRLSRWFHDITLFAEEA